MTADPAIQSAIQQYLDAVAASWANAPAERRDMLLRELGEHIYEALNVRTSGRPATLQDAYAVLSEMDLPENYADTARGRHEERRPDTKLVALALLCSGLQIAGLALAVAGIPVVGAIAGFAAIVSFFIIWSSPQSPKWLVRLTGIAALCGLGTIIMEMARAL